MCPFVKYMFFNLGTFQHINVSIFMLLLKSSSSRFLLFEQVNQVKSGFLLKSIDFISVSVNERKSKLGLLIRSNLTNGLFPQFNVKILILLLVSISFILLFPHLNILSDSFFVISIFSILLFSQHKKVKFTQDSIPFIDFIFLFSHDMLLIKDAS